MQPGNVVGWAFALVVLIILIIIVLALLPRIQ